MLGLCGGDARAALGLALEPPPREAVEAAARQLRRLGAISVDGASEALTPLGTHLARMPVDLRVGKMLLYGAMRRCNPTHTHASSPTYAACTPTHTYARRCASPGAMLGCIDPVLTIAAASSLSRPPFLAPFDKRQEAAAAHAPFRGEMSDQLF